MSKSEIFDSFVKIAREKGMIPKTAASTAADIEKLYNVKPECPKDMEYEYNITENAHKHPVVISPSHDKINGLLENDNERQSIMINIVNKMPNGFLMQKKYAENNLMSSLVCTANDLDNNNKDELRALADTCLMQLHAENKKINKVAYWPIAIAVASFFGAIYAHQHLQNLSDGLKSDFDKLMSELEDFKDSNSNLGVGHDYDDELKKVVQGFENDLNAFWAQYSEISGVIDNIEVPANPSEMVSAAKKPSAQAAVEAKAKLEVIVKKISNDIATVERNFKSDMYKRRHTKDTGILSSLMEKAHIVGGNTSLFADNFKDVLNAIPAFKSSVKELIEMLNGAREVEKRVKEDAEKAHQEQSEMGVGESKPTPTKTPEATRAPETPEQIASRWYEEHDLKGV